MRRTNAIKWEPTVQIRPVHNLISTDFPKYYPQPWKFMDGRPRIELLLTYEYQRMWITEREAWQKRMYPENEGKKTDFVKRYILSFKSEHQPPKHEIKKPFKMKKFEKIGSSVGSKRPPGDKAMAFKKIKKTDKPQDNEKHEIDQTS